ncbi:MAG: restriction endonuclease, partial [Candidatus Latescibacteria bacterium]|nr:restriction endonuclease [Candidatus Latescibacterota bacterium]
MAIPDFQTVFLPLLQTCSDGKEYRLSDVIDIITKHFDLTEEEINERLP